jgi:hypothetical protein
MDNISSQIGALELGEHVAGHDDDVLEAAEMGPNTTRLLHHARARWMRH